MAVEAMESRFLIHVFPARRLYPPVLVAELPLRPDAGEGALGAEPQNTGRRAKRANQPGIVGNVRRTGARLGEKPPDGKRKWVAGLTQICRFVPVTFAALHP